MSEPLRFAVERDADGVLVVTFRAGATTSDIERAAVGLAEMSNEASERLVVCLPSEGFSREMGSAWSEAVKPMRRRFTASSIVGLRSKVARMIIGAMALADGQRLTFHDTLSEAKRHLSR